MNLIQIILFVLAALLALYVFRKFRSSVFDVLIFFGFLAVGVFFIIFPGVTTKLANALGVGRGVDLLFYLSILFFAFVCLKLYERIRKLEQTLHKIVRDKAISEAKKN